MAFQYSVAARNAAIDAVESTIGTAPILEIRTEIRRQSPLIASLGPALGLSEAQIDSLFIAAAAIP